MRLWSLHPTYLDTKGLLAVWREGLLAQQVLKGGTKGYSNHPQLKRFKEYEYPLKAITTYLHVICDEAEVRGYVFQRNKLIYPPSNIKLCVSLGQLAYEWEHLHKKLKSRDLQRYLKQQEIKKYKAHPLFKIISGEVESWEKV